jgi:hypothetical protein
MVGQVAVIKLRHPIFKVFFLMATKFIALMKFIDNLRFDELCLSSLSLLKQVLRIR